MENNYFISYQFTEGGNIGFGNGFYEMSFEINNSENLSEVGKFIYEKLKNENDMKNPNVVIMNFFKVNP